MQDRNPACRVLTIVSLLVLSLGTTPVTAAPALSADGRSFAEGPEAETTPLPAHASANWWATVQEDIRRSEYHVTWQDKTYLPDVPAAYHAPNRAHNLRTYFTSQGPVVIPRAWTAGAEAPPWRWGLRLAAWGREGALRPAQAATLHPDANRVEYRRGEVVEWYVNDERGLAQGFTLMMPPESDGANDESPVILKMAFSGNLTPKLTGAGHALELATPNGRSGVHYGALHASDATGQELPVRFALGGQLASILVDATEAVYPLTIDAVVTGLSPEADWTYHPPVFVPPINAYVGCSVATAGDVNGDGYSDVIVGAYGYDAGQTDEGKILVFYGSATGLDTAVSWAAESNQASSRFGWSATTAGDVNRDGYADVVVGAFWYDNGQSDEGAAFVYHGSGTGLDLDGTRTGGTPQNADWTAESNQGGARFGIRVATAGDVNRDGYADVVVGADEYNNGQTGEGAAFVYHGSATGLGPDGTPQNADWMGESNQGDASFGNSVATAGDVNGDGYSDVIIGAPYYDNGQGNEGRIYVYHGSTNGLSATGPNWTAESNQSNARLGSVATAGDVNGDGYADVVVGAYFYFAGQTREGAAFVYHGSATGLNLGGTRSSGTPDNADWRGESDQYDAQLGGSVGTAGDVNGDGYADVIVGAYLYDGAQTDGGAAFVYHGSATGLDLDGTRPRGNPVNADWADAGDQEDGGFGFSVATAGDVNGDGCTDVIVGMPYYDVSQPPFGNTDAGLASAYYGSPAGLAPDAAWDQQGDYAATWRFGSSVATAGDVNGDGYADIIVGAPRYGTYNRGMVLVYYGSDSGPGDTADWTAVGNVVGSEMRFGYSAATAGDVNGDGYDDVIVGTEDYGRAYVYHGSSSGLDLNGTRPTGNPDNADWTATSDPNQVGPSRFGFSVGTAGDVNGDGYADVIVGAPGYNGYPYTREGWAYVYHGSASGLSTEPDWPERFYLQTDSLFGYSVATAGDVNGDGCSDVVIGASGYNKEEPLPGKPDVGAAFVYYGSPSGLSNSPDREYHGYLEGGFFGQVVAAAGDVNGDGYADVLVGYPYWSSQPEFGLGEGLVYVYYGAATGLSQSYDWSSTDCNPSYSNTCFAWSVGTAGDVNGDGYADMIIGAPFTQFEDDMGQAFVFHGSGTGLPELPCTGLAWHVVCAEEDAHMGWSAATAGDVNGDGYADVIVGAPNFSTSSTGSWTEGKAYVYYGNDGAGLSLNPRQRRASDGAPIAHLGKSDSVKSFRLALTGRTPFGRGKVKLQWEVKPLGTPFDGTGTRESNTWRDIGATGAELNELVSGLDTDTPYHWRVRLHYHPATTPFQQYSRWVHVPWNGWTEQDLRTGSGIYLPLMLRAYP